jgi:hypothetical protein
MRAATWSLAIALVACGPSASTTRPDPERQPEPHHHHHPPGAPDAGPPPSPADAGVAPSADAGTAVAPPDPLAEERAAYDRARPVFDRFCASCHVRREGGRRTAALRHFDMSTYPFGGHHAGELASTIRHVLGADGSRPTMPRDDPGAVQGNDLALIRAWADAYDRAHAAGVHPPAHRH